MWQYYEQCLKVYYNDICFKETGLDKELDKMFQELISFMKQQSPVKEDS